GGRICITRDVILFGNQATGSTATQSSVVSNCGDAPWSFTDVSIHPATAAAYHVATSCASGQSLEPAQACSVDVTFAPIAPGQVSGGVWLHNTTSTPDQIVTFYGRGVDAQAGGATLEFTPGSLNFAAQVVGTTSPPQTLTLNNRGPSALTLKALVLNGSAALDYRAPGNCILGVAMPAGSACELYFTFTPSAPGTRVAQLNVDAPELASLALMSIAGTGIAALPPAIDVIEFYNAPLNHYFLTAVPEEAAAIEQGVVGPNWRRTGFSFRSFAAAATVAGLPDVCRFFGMPGIGPSSHFYTADPAECTLVKANPRWLFENIAFRALLPIAGVCPAATEPVIRFFWPGQDVAQSRHRYVRDAAELARMRAAAWIEEGPVFCSPVPPVQ
ncbi:MAG: choice-of-anchor D domain-containing protein, partial [Casimicrobiaceae bacterium]